MLSFSLLGSATLEQIGQFFYLVTNPVDAREYVIDGFLPGDSSRKMTPSNLQRSSIATSQKREFFMAISLSLQLSVSRLLCARLSTLLLWGVFWGLCI
jgi:hypothetical protein